MTLPLLMSRKADHPRSRGVYSKFAAECWVVDGSSPLARGLLERHPSGRRTNRIIPARAGFTFVALPTATR